MKNFDQNKFMPYVISQPWFSLDFHDESNDAMTFFVSILKPYMHQNRPEYLKLIIAKLLFWKKVVGKIETLSIKT